MTTAQPAGQADESHTPDLTSLGEITPDDLLILSRVTELTPVAGQPATYVRETGRLVRYNRIVMLNIPAVAPYDGELRFTVAADPDTAAVTFGNEREAMRRDGWTVREPDPWEVPDPLRSDAEVSF